MAEGLALFKAIEDSPVQLAAYWVFDFAWAKQEGQRVGLVEHGGRRRQRCRPGHGLGAVRGPARLESEYGESRCFLQSITSILPALYL